jgi:hypothetical protein
MANVPRPLHFWLVDAKCVFSDSTSTTTPSEHVEPPSVPVPTYVPTKFIDTLRQFSPDATAMFTLTEGRLTSTDLTEVRPPIQA